MKHSFPKAKKRLSHGVITWKYKEEGNFFLTPRKGEGENNVEKVLLVVSLLLAEIYI